MRLLTVPNWSFGRSRELLRRFEEVVSRPGLRIHYIDGDVDHNRTVTAFSGDAELVVGTLLDLAGQAFPVIDLTRHVGVHPRVGALDVCPFLPLNGTVAEANRWVEEFARKLAMQYEVPVFLYEKSERGRHEADLPALRKGGFGSLIGKELQPDFGPCFAHPRLGVTVAGVRDFLLAINVDLDVADPSLARSLARDIRILRAEGDPRFLGVRALGFALASRGLSQVSLNLTLPDLTPPDAIIEWVARECRDVNVKVAGTELIGVIRPQDLPGASRLPVRPEQVVE